MSSLWKDLLFLHGHLTHADLAWRPDVRTDADRPDTIAKRKSRIRKARLIASACCMPARPRLAGPR
ncbi:MAG: hypothetical protein KGJ32_01555 [Xanthomonadaceae bacterium]|nr:hypothetical protein [Xanthomonadaceae bacterium]